MLYKRKGCERAVLSPIITVKRKTKFNVICGIVLIALAVYTLSITSRCRMDRTCLIEAHGNKIEDLGVVKASTSSSTTCVEAVSFLDDQYIHFEGVTYSTKKARELCSKIMDIVSSPGWSFPAPEYSGKYEIFNTNRDYATYTPLSLISALKVPDHDLYNDLLLYKIVEISASSTSCSLKVSQGFVPFGFTLFRDDQSGTFLFKVVDPWGNGEELLEEQGP